MMLIIKNYYNIYSQKRFIIEKQIARHFLLTPIPFYETQIINHFLNSRISANRDIYKRVGILANCESE